MAALSSTVEVAVESSSEVLMITISKIAVPLGIGMAVTAEVVGVCVFTDILDLVLVRSLGMKNSNQCIDAIIRSH